MTILPLFTKKEVAVVTTETPPIHQVSESLEDVLVWMTQYGKPRLGYYNKWFCNIEMFVTGVGCTFDIKSEFGCETPIIAATMCKERMIKALKELGVMK